MELLRREKNTRNISVLYVERAALTAKVIPVLMALAGLFAVFFLGVYALLGRPMQWLVMLLSMTFTFCLFAVGYLFSKLGQADIAVYFVVIALNLLGVSGTVALDGWFAMGVLLAYVGIACARLLTGRLQNQIVIVMTILGVISQIILTYFGPISKYTTPVVLQILLWVGYAISGLYVVAYILDVNEKSYAELIVQAEDTENQLHTQITLLEKQTVKLQQRSDFLINVIQVIKDVSKPQNYNEMLDMLVQAIQKQFGFYHVAYFEVSGPLTPAVLLTAAGEFAEAWKERDFCIQLDTEDPIADVARLGRLVLSGSNDQSPSRVPTVKSRISVPVHRSESGIIGVLDIQDRDEEVFGEGEVILLQMLGEQISLNLESVLRFEDVSQRLAVAQRLSRESNLTSWWEWMHTNSNLSYRFNTDRSARKMIADDSQDLPELTIPLSTIQGEKLGKVTARKEKSWTKEEITLLHSLIEQVEQTLENARLYEATQRRAAREQLTRRITDSIRAAETVEEAMRRAVTELAYAVNVEKVSAQLNVKREMGTTKGDSDE